MICSRKMMLAMLLATAVSAMKNVRPNGFRRRLVVDGMNAAQRSLEKIQKRYPSKVSKPSRPKLKWSAKDLLVRKLEILNRSRTKVDVVRRNKAQELEDGFKQKAEKINTAQNALDLYSQSWKNYDLEENLESCSAKTVRKIFDKKRNTVRVIQFNVLAHGLSAEGCGFATWYKPEAKVDDIKKHAKKIDSKKKELKIAKKKLEIASDELKGKLEKDVAKLKQEATLLKVEHRVKFYEEKKVRDLIFSITEGDKSEVECTDLQLNIKNSEGKGTGLERKTEKRKLFPFPERMRRIAGLVLKHSPDIITMEELDRYDTMHKILKECDYKGEIQRKPTDPRSFDKDSSPTTMGNGTGNGGVTDGVAIFWNTKRFKSLGVVERGHLYGSFKNGKGCGNAEKMVYMIMKLQNIKTNDKFLVATAHLKSGKDPKDLEKKMAQSQQMAHKLAKLQRKTNLPIIYGLDFNTDAETAAFKEFQNQTKEWLVSAYDKYSAENPDHFTALKWRKGGMQEKKIKKEHEKQTIDFIFHSKPQATKPGFKRNQVLTVPSYNMLLGGKAPEEFLCLPNLQYPSDHFMIGADLELVKAA